MGIEDLKRWHWALTGLSLGLVIAYLQIAVGGDSLTTGARATTLSPAKFEEYLRQPAVEGYSKVRNIVVYPADGDLVQVGMEILRPLPPDDPRRAKLRVSSTDARACEYAPAWLNAKAPYAPVDDLSRTVHVRVSLDDKTVEINHADARFRPAATGVGFAGWAGKGEGGRDPGERSSVSLPLRRAGYQFTVKVASSFKNNEVANLSARFNGHALKPFERVGSSVLRTRISIADFANEPSQSLEFSNTGHTPLLLREIQLVDASYSVFDYLQSARAQNPRLGFRYAWWAGKAARLSIWGMGGLILVGGVWPTLLGLLSGAGFGRARAASDNYDLSRFQGGPAPTATPKNSSSDPQRAREVEQALDAAIQAVTAQLASAPPPIMPKPAATPISLSSNDAEERPSKSTPAPQFSGEFYPVARSDVPGRSKLS